MRSRISAQTRGLRFVPAGGVLVLAWRGIGDDLDIHYAVSSDGLSWPEAQQGTVPGAASADGPSLAWDGSVLWMVWRGIPADPADPEDPSEPGDQGLYFATWDLTNPWSIVSNIGNTGSSCGPSIAAAGSPPTPIMAWKGVEGDSGNYYSAFTSSGWSGQQKDWRHRHLGSTSHLGRRGDERAQDSVEGH
jgi:hypothetical protein